MSCKAPPYYSFGWKCRSMWDDEVHPFRIAAPGPHYKCDVIDKKGRRCWADTPVPCFGKEARFWEPETRLSGTPYLSSAHALRANYAIHSPGPVYNPKLLSKHQAAPAFSMCGNADRFYSRFQPQRIA